MTLKLIGTGLGGAFLALAGCLDGSSAGQATGSPETPPFATTQTQTTTATFELVYISGHLGTYYDCSDQAIPTAGSLDDAVDTDGDCLEGQPCVDVVSCEHAELMVRLTNNSAVPLVGAALTDIELLFGEDETPLASVALSVTPLNGGAVADRLEPGAYRDLRVVFRGLLAWGDYSAAIEASHAGDAERFSDGAGDQDGETNRAKIHVIFAAGEHAEEATSPMLYPVSDIDT
ncbi:MAG: hypothetical protein ACI9MR_002583 [Myxococcota bacterium]|jgi:hypothetical protein